MRYLSPLRYPGGKARLALFIGELIAAQPTPTRTYVEPFAGGAGVGLALLVEEYVDEIVLNDLDPGIAAFWRSVFEDSPSLVSLVRSTRPTVAEWQRQRQIHADSSDQLALGFATFFLNRTNRSGILGARPIGGLAQDGEWGIGARYAAEDLAARIERLAAYGSRVTVSESDGVALVGTYLREERCFVYADPPYLSAGDDLYLNALGWEDHLRLAAVLKGSKRWLLTYDADERVPGELYRGLRCASFDLAHTAATARIGREYAVFSADLVVDDFENLGREGGTLIASGTDS